MAKTGYKILSWLDMGIFPHPIMFSIGLSYDELLNLLKKKKETDWMGAVEFNEKLFQNTGGAGFASVVKQVDDKTFKESKLPMLVLHNVFDFSDYDYITLAHEILHLCQFLLPDFLERDKEHECEAYLHSHIMKQCLKLIRTGKN